ncbi:hypothetical protein ACP70R_028200 [Stipagrostis hirtigluma subsp. patula]
MQYPQISFRKFIRHLIYVALVSQETTVCFEIRYGGIDSTRL